MNILAEQRNFFEMIDITDTPSLQILLSEEIPDYLFHYTSPIGLLGILKSREIWATNISFLNDFKEIEHAVEIARNIIDNLQNNKNEFYSIEELQLLANMHKDAGSAARRLYVVSLTEERDLLSQWRAYSPQTGGYSIGFDSEHLKKIAGGQNFFLCKCVYDHNLKYKIINEVYRNL